MESKAIAIVASLVLLSTSMTYAYAEELPKNFELFTFGYDRDNLVDFKSTNQTNSLSQTAITFTFIFENDRLVSEPIKVVQKDSSEALPVYVEEIYEVLGIEIPEPQEITITKIVEPEVEPTYKVELGNQEVAYLTAEEATLLEWCYGGTGNLAAIQNEYQIVLEEDLPWSKHITRSDDYLLYMFIEECEALQILNDKLLGPAYGNMAEADAIGTVNPVSTEITVDRDESDETLQEMKDRSAEKARELMCNHPQLGIVCAEAYGLFRDGLYTPEVDLLGNPTYKAAQDYYTYNVRSDLKTPDALAEQERVAIEKMCTFYSALYGQLTVGNQPLILRDGTCSESIDPTVRQFAEQTIETCPDCPQFDE